MVDLFQMKIYLLNNGDISSFEQKAIQKILDMRKEWLQDEKYGLEILSFNSYSNEMVEAIKKDIKLLPVTFIVMCLFSCAVYLKRDRVRSSCIMLGLGAITTVLFSLLTSFGLLFIAGVPFSNMTLSLPFITMGIGIDDAFIITGSFNRTDETLNSIDRIYLTFQDCGVSIFVTTLTTATAFFVGLTSDIPTVQDFNKYAAPCIIIDFLYQITFYVALIVANERRIEHRRCDFFPCCKSDGDFENNNNILEDSMNLRFMRKFGSILIEQSLLRKTVLILVFVGMTCISAVKMSKLRVAFDFVEMTPTDSYTRSYTHAVEKYYDTGPYKCMVVFRFLDFSDVSIRE
mmetsp:Transcript_4045/g.5279  ORF Transcript_4045/g.5279 Transcript_4045/m.5279 type:complete len:345 (+) Transcript_4045:366-1400(+)